MVRVFQRILWVTSLLLGVASDPGVIRHNTIYFVSTDSAFNPKYIQDHRLIINPDKISLDVILNIAHDYTHDSWIAVSVARLNRKNKRYRNIFKMEQNVCTILGNKNPNFLTTFVQNYFKMANLPTKCPMTKGNFSWKNLGLEKFNIPNFFNGRYKLTYITDFREGSKPEMITNVTVIWELK